MDDSVKRNIAKAAIYAGIAWVTYKVVTGLASNDSPSKVIKETVAPILTPVETVKDVVAPVVAVPVAVSKKFIRFIKGSPEAKAHMAKLRSMHKKKDSKSMQPAKVEKVMKEFKEGELKTSAGKKVVNKKQAVAIAMSEAGLSKKKVKIETEKSADELSSYAKRGLSKFSKMSYAEMKTVSDKFEKETGKNPNDVMLKEKFFRFVFNNDRRKK